MARVSARLPFHPCPRPGLSLPALCPLPFPAYRQRVQSPPSLPGQQASSRGPRESFKALRKAVQARAVGPLQAAGSSSRAREQSRRRGAGSVGGAPRRPKPESWPQWASDWGRWSSMQHLLAMGTAAGHTHARTHMHAHTRHWGGVYG